MGFNERLLRQAVTRLVKRNGWTREQAWIHVRTYGVDAKVIKTYSNTPNAKNKRNIVELRLQQHLCISCGKESKKYARCIECRTAHAKRERERIRQIRLVRRKKQCA